MALCGKKKVLKVQMNCEKCRTEALKAVAVADGVNSVALVLEGEDKDKVMVIGDGVDAVKLTSSLRKKVDKHADIISVGPVKVQN